MKSSVPLTWNNREWQYVTVMLALWPKPTFFFLCQFHSDSEQGLGPIVASLLLDSAAVTHFQVHADVRQEGEGTGNALTLTLHHVQQLQQ